MPEGIIDPRLVIQQADGTYFKLKPEIKDGYLYYESDYLGLVSIVGDHPSPDYVDEEDKTPDTGGAFDVNPTVKGIYTTTGTNTGDDHNIKIYISMMMAGCIGILYMKKKVQKEKSDKL